MEQYSAALACNSESRPFSAVCFCNRAAAYQALGQVTDAIADCSLAMVLDANYLKVYCWSSYSIYKHVILHAFALLRRVNCLSAT